MAIAKRKKPTKWINRIIRPAVAIILCLIGTYARSQYKCIISYNDIIYGMAMSRRPKIYNNKIS